MNFNKAWEESENKDSMMNGEKTTSATDCSTATSTSASATVDRVNGADSRDSSAAASVENSTKLSRKSSFSSVSIASTSSTKQKQSLNKLSRVTSNVVRAFKSNKNEKSKSEREKKKSTDSQVVPQTPPPRPPCPGQLGAFSFRMNFKYKNVTDGLKALYTKKLKPTEEASLYNEFHGTPMDEAADFDAVPMVLVIGQYSTGKSTLLKYLLGEDYPGINIGPEPTTDKFTVIMHGPKGKIMPGNAVVLDAKMPFRTLGKFGNSFLNRLQCSQMDSNMLDGLGMIDTPGVLAGQKQKTERGYDFCAVLAWFAARVDKILLLFDAHKLDISDELRSVIAAIKPYDEKLRIVLNKSDSVDTSQLIRVHGALMWSLGKALECPEVAKVYLVSFWDRPYVHTGLRDIFDADQETLIKDLKTMPSNSALRKINDFSKRARQVKMHSIIINEVLDRGPKVWSLNKEEKINKVIAGLEDIYSQMEGKHGECSGDFPSITVYKDKLKKIDWGRLKKIDSRLIDRVSAMLDRDMARLMEMAQKIDAAADVDPVPQPRRRQRLSMGAGASPNQVHVPERRIHSVTSFHGPLDMDEKSPFGNTANVIQSHVWSDDYVLGHWLVANDDPERYQEWIRIFEAQSPIDGKLTGQAAKIPLMESNLPEAILRKIWKLSDVSVDGMLDKQEFCLAMYLVDLVVNKGQELPASLPDFLHPSKHRDLLP